MSKGLKETTEEKAYINPRVQVELRLSAINRINELVARDEAMAVVQREYSEPRSDGEKHFYVCPVCGKPLASSANFCFECGQRVDMENIAF